MIQENKDRNPVGIRVIKHALPGTKSVIQENKDRNTGTPSGMPTPVRLRMAEERDPGEQGSKPTA